MAERVVARPGHHARLALSLTLEDGSALLVAGQQDGSVVVQFGDDRERWLTRAEHRWLADALRATSGVRDGGDR